MKIKWIKQIINRYVVVAQCSCKFCQVIIRVFFSHLADWGPNKKILKNHQINASPIIAPRHQLPLPQGVTSHCPGHCTVLPHGISRNYCPKALHKNTERHTAPTIVSWPNPKQWIIVHTSDLMMIRQSIYILSIITRETGKLKTHSPTYCIMGNWENMPYLTNTLDKIYVTGIL